MARKLSAKEKENLTPQNLDKVIILLNPKEGEKPCTKKVACEILGIAYNTSRLDALIKEHQERVAYDTKRRTENKGKKATEGEISSAISDYLEGSSMDEISKRLYRSSSFIKAILIKYGVPIRPTSHSYFKPALIPDESVRDSFNIGEMVYSTQYNVNAIVKGTHKQPDGSTTYKVWLLGDRNYFAFIPAYEMASLDHLTQYGVDYGV